MDRFGFESEIRRGGGSGNNRRWGFVRRIYRPKASELSSPINLENHRERRSVQSPSGSSRTIRSTRSASSHASSIQSEAAKAHTRTTSEDSLYPSRPKRGTTFIRTTKGQEPSSLKSTGKNISTTKEELPSKTFAQQHHHGKEKSEATRKKEEPEVKKQDITHINTIERRNIPRQSAISNSCISCMITWIIILAILFLICLSFLIFALVVFFWNGLPPSANWDYLTSYY